MEFNIAFNTVFYICVFIIPGILLRRFYYHGEFHKEFSQGNLLERLMWTIFSSVTSLFLCGLFFIGIRQFADLLPAISYSTIKGIFDLLASNELPESQDIRPVYSDFLYLIIGIYLLSCIFGLLAHQLVVAIGTHTPLSLFKFNNYWYYFFRGRIKNSSTDRKRKFWYTDVDILVDQEGKAKMYSGQVSDYYVDSVHNQLESIFLENTRRYRFKNLTQGDAEEDKKDLVEEPNQKDSGRPYDLVPIPGDIFCIPYSRVLNMNLTYVTKEKGISWLKKVIWALANILFYAFVIIPFTFFWIEDIPILNFPSFWYKVWFFLTTLITSSIILSNVRDWIFGKDKMSTKDVIIEVAAIFCFLAQYLWILDILNFWPVFSTSIFVLFLLSAGLEDQKKKPSIDSTKDNPT